MTVVIVLFDTFSMLLDYFPLNFIAYCAFSLFFLHLRCVFEAFQHIFIVFHDFHYVNLAGQ